MTTRCEKLLGTMLRFSSEPVELIEAAAATDGQPKVPRFSMLAYSGGVIRQPFGDIVLDLSGLEVSSDNVPILRDHDPGRIVGQSESVSVTASGIRLAGLLNGTLTEVEDIVSTAKRGFKWRASILAPLEAVEWIAEGKTVVVNGRNVKGPVHVARKATLQEVSLTAVPADSKTSVRIAARKREQPMSDESVPTDDTRTPEQIRAEAAAEERRIAGIRKVCGDSFREIAAQAISEGWEPVRAELEVLRASRPKPPAPYESPLCPPIDMQRSLGNPRVLAAAVLCRAGREDLSAKCFGDEPTQRGRRYRHIMDVIADGLRMNGVSVPESRNDTIKAAFSTVSLPGIFADSMNKLLLDEYSSLPRNWEKLAKIVDVNDFRDSTLIRPILQRAPSEIPPTGEFKHQVPGESTYTIRASTFGEMLTFDRRDFVNDDLSALATLPAAMARNALRGLGDLFFQTLLGGIATFWTAGAGNYQEGASTALGIDSLTAAVALMRKQVDVSGRVLDIQPRTLLVPIELEMLARQLVQSVELSPASGGEPVGNPFRGLLDPVAEPRLSNAGFTGASALHWWVFAAPTDAPMAVCFVRGQRAPTIEFFNLQAEPSRLAISYRCYWDYGTTLVDLKASVRSKGEA